MTLCARLTVCLLFTVLSFTLGELKTNFHPRVSELGVRLSIEVRHSWDATLRHLKWSRPVISEGFHVEDLQGRQRALYRAYVLPAPLNVLWHSLWNCSGNGSLGCSAHLDDIMTLFWIICLRNWWMDEWHDKVSAEMFIKESSLKGISLMSEIRLCWVVMAETPTLWHEACWNSRDCHTKS